MLYKIIDEFTILAKSGVISDDTLFSIETSSRFHKNNKLRFFEDVIIVLGIEDNQNAINCIESIHSHVKCFIDGTVDEQEFHAYLTKEIQELQEYL